MKQEGLDLSHPPQLLDEQMRAIQKAGTRGRACPKCGAHGVLHHNPALREEYRYSVECVGCGNDYPKGALCFGSTAQEAVDRWNAGLLVNWEKMGASPSTGVV